MSRLRSDHTGHTVEQHYEGNDRILFGIVSGVLTYWLFAQTTYNVAPSMQKDLHFRTDLMTFAISITALTCGILVVVMGGLADRFGRVRVAVIGNVLGLAGALILALLPGGAGGAVTDLAGPLHPHPLTGPLMFVARVLQGLSAACVMPATLALVKVYWSGAGRQRAVSLWSLGSWGGASIAAFLAGFMDRTPVLGWRAIFLVSAVFSLMSILIIRKVPESRAVDAGRGRFDIVGLLVFMVAMVALQVWMTQGEAWGWGSPLSLALVVAAVLFLAAFVWLETRTGNDGPFIDFGLFRNRTFTGCLLSNMLLNGTAGGMVLVISMLLQTGGTQSALQAGRLTLGYAIGLIVFIRLGERLLQVLGPRRAMIIGCGVSALGVACMLPTHIMENQYLWLVIAGQFLYGVGIGIYATPSTDTALATLPETMGGAGAGLYKMSSTIGGAFGLAVSSAVYLGVRGHQALGGASNEWLMSMIQFVGRQDNIANRQGAMLALSVNVVALIVAILAIMWAVPKQQKALD